MPCVADCVAADAWAPAEPERILFGGCNGATFAVSRLSLETHAAGVGLNVSDFAGQVLLRAARMDYSRVSGDDYDRGNACLMDTVAGCQLPVKVETAAPTAASQAAAAAGVSIAVPAPVSSTISKALPLPVKVEAPASVKAETPAPVAALVAAPAAAPQAAAPGGWLDGALVDPFGCLDDAFWSPPAAAAAKDATPKEVEVAEGVWLVVKPAPPAITIDAPVLLPPAVGESPLRAAAARTTADNVKTPGQVPPVRWRWRRHQARTQPRLRRPTRTTSPCCWLSCAAARTPTRAAASRRRAPSSARGETLICGHLVCQLRTGCA